MNKLLIITGLIGIIISATVMWAVAINDPTASEVCASTTYEDTPVDKNPTETTIATSSSIPKTNVAAGKASRIYFNVDLDKALQDVIFDECERYGIDPAIVIAMIERESRFDRYALGDDGRSFGLMQIQPKWHLRLMIEMGCTDLFDPVQNIKVGIAILGSLKTCYNDVGIALTYYNSGKIGFNEYAKAILARANEI